MPNVGAKLMAIDQVMVMHDSRCFMQHRQDSVLHDPIQVLVHMGSIQGELLISVESDTGSGCINENNGVIPIQQGGSDTTGADFICKVVEFGSVAFLDLGEISLAD